MPSPADFRHGDGGSGPDRDAIVWGLVMLAIWIGVCVALGAR